MIRVLRSRREVDEALSDLRSRGLPLHVTPEKNWDHALLLRLVESLPRQAAIVDMGSGDAYTLALLHALGFRNLQGIDLAASWRRRLGRLARRLTGRFRPLDLVRRGDMCDTRLPPRSVDLITAVSVIEHGVPLEPFLRECARLLRAGGLLFVTTDYWDDLEMDPARPVQLFGADWRIQNRAAIEGLIDTARQEGLELVVRESVPGAGERTVSFAGYQYTFLALHFARVERSLR